MAVNWAALQNFPNIGANIGDGFTRGYGAGQELARRGAQEGALAALSRNPNDPQALQQLVRVNPHMAHSFEVSNAQRAQRQREVDGRHALSAWMFARQRGAGQNALAPSTTSPPIQFEGAAAPASTESEEAAWMRMVDLDPVGATEAKLKALQLDEASRKELFGQFDHVARLTRGAVDQPSYERALSEARANGIDLGHLPREYDSNLVNRLQLQALGAKEYLANARADQRLDWDIEDDRIDNTRSDREVSDRMNDRTQRRSLTVRGQDTRAATQRRGQDLGAARRTGRRPADGSYSGAVAIGPNGQRIIVKDGKWVDAKTGAPIQ